METSTSLVQQKLASLAEAYGCSVDELLRLTAMDSLTPGICMNLNCDYTTEYEPDQREGWCEECDTQSVKSLLVLLGLV